MKNSTQFTVRSAQFPLVTMLVTCVLFIACSVTYDMPVIYKKNFQPGTHDSLRFDGYYTSEWDMQMTERVKPIFLYRDGSVWFGEELMHYDVAQETIKKGTSFSWGNYKIDGDTIYIERFNLDKSTNNYRRVIIKGIVLSKQIKWIQREENRQNPVATAYKTNFMASTFKPDSSANWTRTRAQYNK